MMVESKDNQLQSETGYINARPNSAKSTKPLVPHGRTKHSGQSATESFGETSAQLRLLTPLISAVHMIKGRIRKSDTGRSRHVTAPSIDNGLLSSDGKEPVQSVQKNETMARRPGGHFSDATNAAVMRHAGRQFGEWPRLGTCEASTLVCSYQIRRRCSMIRLFRVSVSGRRPCKGSTS
jgi:hypothetical protein